jgi:L-iditol 2-dehydrogenase
VRVAAVGICGSEFEAVASRSPRRTPPLILGHEFCGEVEAVAEGVTEWAPGDRVVASSIISCGRCPDCRDGATHLCARREVFGMNRPGAFAERVPAPAPALFALPERVSPIQGALVEPLANAVHVWSLVRARFPETVVVFGGGAIGLMTLQVARAAGALRLVAVDADEARLEMAHAVGAEPLWSPIRTARDLQVAIALFAHGRIDIETWVRPFPLEEGAGFVSSSRRRPATMRRRCCYPDYLTSICPFIEGCRPQM